MDGEQFWVPLGLHHSVYAGDAYVMRLARLDPAGDLFPCHGHIHGADADAEHIYPANGRVHALPSLAATRS